MSWILVVTLLAAIAVGCSQNIRCFSDHKCNPESAVITVSSMENCCRHGIEPFGVSYTNLEENQAQCFSCPVELGFVMTEFTICEQSESYQVEVAIFSGYVNETVIFVELHHTTTTKGDIEVPDKSIHISEVAPQEYLQTIPVELVASLDSIAQEENEEFTLMLNCSDELWICNNSRSTLSGIIVDNTAVIFEFSEDDYSATEGHDSAIEITVTRSLNVSLANPVTLTVIPLTVEDALRQDMIGLPDVDSQNRANADDFNITSVPVKFIADVKRKSIITNLPVRILITDDHIDEDDSQVFVVMLVVSSALDKTTIKIKRNTSMCTIFDNDALQIGFKQSQYSYVEPNQTKIVIDVMLVKEDNRETELTYIINVAINSPPLGIDVATNGSDYLGFFKSDVVTFLPEEQNITLPVCLLPDDLFEGIEGFRITATYNFPAYNNPETLFSSTLIVIKDVDYIEVGFEKSIYAVDESDDVEVCVQVSDSNFSLEFEIILSYQSHLLTADGSDFSEIYLPNYISIEPEETDGVFKTCFTVEIYDDAITEETESFILELTFESSEISTVLVEQNTTKIVIYNNDSPEDLVNCFPSMNCNERVGEITSVDACCQHDTSPFGLSYSLVSGSNRCHLCPTEFGFIEEELFGTEQAEEYTAHLKFFSGTVVRGSGLMINLVLNLHTACDQDIEFPSRQIFIKPVRHNSSDVQVYPVSFTYKLDNVAQEENETFTVSIEANPSYLLHPKLRQMTGIIMDNDFIAFQLSENDYRQTEGLNAYLVAQIKKLSTTILANPVTFTVQPITVEKALDDRIITLLEAQRILSLCRADSSDFDNATIKLVYSPDDVNSLDVNIRIYLDDFVETDEEFFVLQLDVEDNGTINKDLIRIERRISYGVIDNRETETVRCFSDSYCSHNGDTGLSFIEECCQHGVPPFGVAYIGSSEEGCHLCPIVFGFVEPSLTAQESIDAYQVGLAFSSGQSAVGPFSINTVLIPGTANPENDIGFISNRLFFPQVVESDELQIEFIDIIFLRDSITQEGNETFSLTFSINLEDLPGATLNDSFRGVIVDSTTATFEMSEEDYREREGETGFMPIVITKISEAFFANPVTLIVFPWTVAQAEAEGLVPSVLTVPADNPFAPNRADENDFNTSSITIVYPANEGGDIITDLNVPIPVFDDIIDEAIDQYFIAEFRIVHSVNISLLTLDQRASRCRIVDNDPLRIGFQLSQYDFFEPESESAAFHVTLIKENNAESEQTFGLQITFGDFGTGINAATLQPADEQDDYDYVVTQPGDSVLLILFEPQYNEVNFSLTIFADDLAEGTEGLRATLLSKGGLFPHFVSTEMEAFSEILIRILDADFAFIGFEQPSYTINENDSTVEVCAILKNPPAGFNIIVTLTTTQVSADGSDYQQLTQERPRFALFMRGSTSNKTCTQISIYQDDFFEDTESFNVTLGLEEEVTGVILDLPVTEVFIQDINQLTIAFIHAPYQANETDNFVMVEFGVLKGNIAPSASVSIVLSFSDLTAANGSDYHKVDFQVFVFDSNTSTHSALVSILNDDTFELTEVFQANLEFENGYVVPRVTLGPSANITILDDLVFGFDPDIYTVKENASIQLLTVRLISGDAGAVQIILSAATDDSRAGSMAAADLDYRSNSGQLTPINIGQNSAEFLVEIIDNDLTEKTRVFDVMLTGIEVLTSSDSEVPLSAIHFHPDRAQVQILDDDISIVGFSSTTYATQESEGVVYFIINVLKGSIAFNLSVIFTTLDGSALSGNDYEAVNEEYIITGRGSVAVPVNLTDDSIREETESFFGILKIKSGESVQNIVFAPNQAEVFINNDNDTVVPTMTMESTLQQPVVSATSVIHHKSTLVPAAPVVSSFTLSETKVPSQTAAPTVQTTTSVSIDMLALGIVFGILSLAILLTGVIALLFCVRCRRKNQHESSYDAAASKENVKIEKKQSDFDMYVDQDEMTGGLRHFTVQSSYKLKLPRTLMIPSCRLKLDSMLGQGEFGMVYKGYIKRGYSDSITDIVAVKTLRGFVERESVHSLLKECGKMYTFDHPNILKLTGVCMDGGPAPYIILPFMANGSLKDYLLKERSNFLLDPSSADPENAVTVEKRLLDMCDQVAMGMEYLASKRVIHRDLAARNCMLDVTNVIKVADFGLAESMGSSKDYFRQDQENTVKLPIKWLALESINDGIFSEKSDVWSFGVTCWEIFNGGKTPYPGIHPADISKQLEEGMRLEKPKNAAVTDEIYSIMRKCWNTNSHLRPSFSELVNELSSLLGGMAGYLDLEASNTKL